MAKLVWRVKLIAELGSGIVSETEVARIERDDFAVAETVGLTLDEGKRLTAATQAEIVRVQVTTMGERFRWCEHCGAKLFSKGYYPATFRSAFGDVGVRIRRLHACSCRSGLQEPKSFAALLATGGIAPELAYITAKFAALTPFARVATLLSELLPIGGAVNAGTVRNRTVRVGATVAKLTPAGTQMLEPDAVTPAAIVGLDGGYVRSRHRRPERNFEVIAGKVIGAAAPNIASPSPATAGLWSSSLAPWCGRVCGAIRQPLCCRTVMRACGTSNVACCPKRLPCWTGFISLCVSSTPCRPQPVSVREQLTPPLASHVDANSSMRNGASGTAAGGVAWLSLPASAAGLKPEASAMSRVSELCSTICKICSDISRRTGLGW